jgi:alanyl-tRNA synthetase
VLCKNEYVTGHEIRQQFLDYFAQRGHRIVRSSSLVPANDPTLLFANAGMNQFKDTFLGAEKRDYVRACSSQKCVRAGGKHSDLENVGYTRRHHTFFEMLGNFSFGDYFKTDAIAYAWELITKVYGLPKDRLYFTVFREDDDAEQLWQKVTGVPKSRIFRLDEKDNFWQMGDTGPCGPCSEIHYDLGPDACEPGHEDEEFPSDCGGRYVEIWNLVFMQFNRDAAGVMTPLPRPSIDTGLGLERLAAVMQGKLSNYDTDLIRPIVDYAAELAGVIHGEDPRVDSALRIAADHSRATAFLIHDGVVPANEGRGYVLRKIMRRGLRHIRRIGLEEPFLYKMTGFVAELMKPAYPELLESVSRVARIVKDEEHRYATTYQVAERVFHDEVKSAVDGVLPGAIAFKLYDTYGLALDEQEEMAREYGLHIDNDAFNSEMEKQRERARASWKGADKGTIAPAYQELRAQGATRFLGYEMLSTPDAKVVGLLVDEKPIESVGPNTQAEVVLDQTTFYAETGGQVGDNGTLCGAQSGIKVATVESVYPAVAGLSVHRIVSTDAIHVGDVLRAEVDASSRHATMRNHTATHLMHAALRQVLGAHVKQAGSVVDPARLRFDFTHYTSMDPDEVAEVERLVNEQVLRNTAVTTDVMELDQALTTGAMALFGEKYGEKVRVVSVPGFSRELCGGTHATRTGDIGLCKIVYEGSISAGVRRIEAITGEGALGRFQKVTGSLTRVAELMRAAEPELYEQAERMLAREKALEKQVDQLKQKLAHSLVADLKSRARAVKDLKLVAAYIDDVDRQQLRWMADSLRNQGVDVIVLATGGGELVSAVRKEATAKVHAGKLAGRVAQLAGGKAGGRPDMAEGGVKDAAKLKQVIEQEIEGLL